MIRGGPQEEEEFNPPDPWDDYDGFFSGEDEFFDDEPPPADHTPDLSLMRQAERMAVSIRRHQQGRRP